MTNEELLDIVAQWSDGRKTALCVTRDNEAGTCGVHYTGTLNNLAKCIVALMEEDEDVARAVYIGASIYANKHLDRDFINEVNDYALAINVMRKNGSSQDEIEDALLN